jgi:hypothetical protein
MAEKNMNTYMTMLPVEEITYLFVNYLHFIFLPVRQAECVRDNLSAVDLKNHLRFFFFSQLTFRIVF